MLGSHLPESDEAEMNVFLDKIYQLLPILGINYFISTYVEIKNKEDIYYCNIKGLEAKGKRSSNGFIVFKDSEAVLEHRPSAKWAKKIREELAEKNILIKQTDRFLFTKDYEFGSPSTAGGVVRGGATNGLLQWKTRNGITLKEVENKIK